MRSVAVVIAARDAMDTIGRAVGSALASDRVSEVIVVSDGSTDATEEAARAAAGGDGRLRILSLPENVGPAEARNRALEIARADAVAILDADDQFLPGRLEALTARDDWDLVADNIVFAADPGLALPRSLLDAEAEAGFRTLTLREFALGNLARPGVTRGELGFLKPLISREFLQRTGLHYDRRLRLGEDYDLYVRALLAGGQFLLTHRPGYLAQVRPNSLSGRHGTADLEALADAMRRHLDAGPLPRADGWALRRVLAQVRHRHAHRAALDIKARAGVAGVIRALSSRPDWIIPVATGVLRDKLGRGAPADVPQGYRLLLAERNRGSG